MAVRSKILPLEMGEPKSGNNNKFFEHSCQPFVTQAFTQGHFLTTSVTWKIYFIKYRIHKMKEITNKTT